MLKRLVFFMLAITVMFGCVDKAKVEAERQQQVHIKSVEYIASMVGILDEQFDVNGETMHINILPEERVKISQCGDDYLKVQGALMDILVSKEKLSKSVVDDTDDMINNSSYVRTARLMCMVTNEKFDISQLKLSGELAKAYKLNIKFNAFLPKVQEVKEKLAAWNTDEADRQISEARRIIKDNKNSNPI
jgi:hypothetical protein